jgi:acetyltransferase-like isoleucine patch superfamily enzyme
MLEKILLLYRQLDAEMRRKWGRSLPFEELLFDRWAYAQVLGFGEGSSIYHNSYLYGDIKVGTHTWIGPLTILDGGGGLEIGNYCSISSGVHIYTHDTVRWAVSGGKAFYESAPVKIEDYCHIGASAVVAKGVTIGSHSVVGACSFVRHDVEPYTLVSGVPAIVIGRVVIDGDKVRYEV